MSFVSDLFVGILVIYLAFTNTLATGLTNLFQPDEEAETQYVIDEPEASFFTELPSRLRSIPDVLLKSAEYQQAAVGDAVGLKEPTTKDPLDAVVNIYCTFRTPDFIRTTTGTGFFIDPDGVIMTNAHIAQFLLLAEADESKNAECTVRNGNPASPKYTADLLYIPPAWVQENAAIINDPSPMGTGERDYALLYVTGSVSNEPLPAMFPALPYSTELLSTSAKNSDVVAAGYPADGLFAQARDASVELIPRAADTSISELYTFGSKRADVFSIRGSVVGAGGSSGGPVLDENGTVIGMIVTRGDDAADGPGSLRAITLSHVERTIQEETGFALAGHLDGNIALRSQVFSETLTPFLLAIFEAAE